MRRILQALSGAFRFVLSPFVANSKATRRAAVAKKHKRSRSSFRSRRPPSRPRHKRTALRKVAKWALGILTAVITAVIIAYFTGMFAPKKLGATLSKLTFNANVTLEEYLKQSSLSPDEYVSEELQQTGCLIHFQVEIEGFTGRECAARWSVYDAESRSRIDLPEPWTEAQKPINFTPEQATDSAAEYFWVPPLNTDRTFFVRVELYDDKGVRLTFADTEPIRLLPRPGLAHE